MDANRQARLLEWLKAKRAGMPFEEFALLSGISKSSLQRYESGSAQITRNAIISLARAFPDFPQWAKEWDMSGEAHVRQSAPLVVDPADLADAGVGAFRDGAVPAVRHAGMPEFIRVPLLDARASAGRGVENVEVNYEGGIAFRRDWLRAVSGNGGNGDGLITMRVTGDSMQDTLSDGDTILVDTSVHDVIADGIYVFRIENEYSVKRLQRRGATMVVVSDNRRYGEYVWDPQQPLIIFGRVVWAGKRL